MEYHYEQTPEPTEYLKIGEKHGNIVIIAKYKDNGNYITQTIPYSRVDTIACCNTGNGISTYIYYYRNRYENQIYADKIIIKGDWQHVINEFFSIH